MQPTNPASNLIENITHTNITPALTLHPFWSQHQQIIKLVY